MTVFEGDKHSGPRVQSEVCVCNDDYSPVRITLATNQLVSVLDLIGTIKNAGSLLLNCCSPEKRF